MRRRVYVRVTISLKQDDVKAVDRLAQQMGLPRSALIRLAVLEYLRRQAKGENSQRIAE